MKPTLNLLLPSLFLPFVGTWIFWHQWLPGPAGFAVYGFTKIWYLGLPLYFLTKVKNSSRRFPRLDRGSLLWGNVTGVALCLLLLLGYLGLFRDASFLQPVPELIHGKLSAFGVQGPLQYAAMSVFVILINSSLEELYWRWCLHGGLRQHLTWPMAAGISGAAFSLHHFIYLRSYVGSLSIAITGTVIIGLVGILFSVLWERTGNLLSAWICHAWADVGLMFVGFLMLRPLWT